MSVDCITSEVIQQTVIDKERVRIQTSSGATYDGTIERADCLGVLFIPVSLADYHPSYILYTDIKKLMLPEHDVAGRR